MKADIEKRIIDMANKEKGFIRTRHLGTFLFCHGFVGYSSKTISCFAQFRVFRVFRGWIKYW